jgi:hypothetical protein
MVAMTARIIYDINPVTVDKDRTDDIFATILRKSPTLFADFPTLQSEALIGMKIFGSMFINGMFGQFIDYNPLTGKMILRVDHLYTADFKINSAAAISQPYTSLNYSIEPIRASLGTDLTQYTGSSV